MTSTYSVIFFSEFFFLDSQAKDNLVSIHAVLTLNPTMFSKQLNWNDFEEHFLLNLF